MNLINTSIFLFFGIILFSCSVGPNDLRELQKNNMDFPELERRTFKNISFLKPEMLSTGYNESYVLSSTNETFQSYILDVFLSVELFDAIDVETIQFSYDNEKSALDAIHDNYVFKRSKSLKEHEISLQKKLPKSVGFNGLVQVIHGKNYEEEKDASYFISTIEVEDEFYVIQMIGKRENMGYLYDDFIDILSSIEN